MAKAYSQWDSDVLSSSFYHPYQKNLVGVGVRSKKKLQSEDPGRPSMSKMPVSGQGNWLSLSRTRKSGLSVRMHHPFLKQGVQQANIFKAAMYVCVNVSFGCFSSYLPIILTTFGYTPLHTQLLLIPVYVCGAASTLIFSVISDRLCRRGVMAMISFAFASTGWLILLVSRSRSLSFGETFLISIGTFPNVILVQSWMNSNIIGYTKRSAAFPKYSPNSR